MPEIEVTIDAFEALLDRHSRQLDREERDHKSAMKAEVDYYNKLHPQGAVGGAGFLDTIIKSITGKGVMGAGIAAGGVAGGIMILAEVIKGLTKESKILSTVQDTVGKALGLLLDLVLLPFLPLLIWGMLMLYTAIMWLGNIWNKTVAPVIPVVPGPGAGVFDWAVFFLKMMELPYALVRAIIAGIEAFLKDLIVKTGTWLQQAWENFKAWLITALTEGWAKVKAGLEDNLITPIKNAIENIKTIFTDAWKKVADGLEENLIKPIKSALNNIRDKFVDFINFIIEKINTILPPGYKITPIQNAAPGGAGNSVTPPSNPTTNNNTFNFFGLQPEGLEQSIKNILRAWGMGWIFG